MAASEIAKIVGELVAAHPRMQIGPETVALYCTALDDLEPEAVQWAARRLIQTSKFFPTVAEIRELVAQAAVGVEKTASEAWEHVIGEVRRVGYYMHDGEPALNDVERRAVRALGGWRSLCMSEEPQGVLRAQFKTAYEDAMRTAVRVANVGRMPALPEGGGKVLELPERKP